MCTGTREDIQMANACTQMLHIKNARYSYTLTERLNLKRQTPIYVEQLELS